MRLPVKGWNWGACAVALAVIAMPSHAAPLINGDFESGDLTGWTTLGDQTYVGVDTGFANTGLYAAYFGPESPAGMAQAVNTESGRQYRVSFWLSLQDSATPSRFSWYWDGVEQAALDDATAFGYMEFSAVVTAGAGSSDLRFEFHNPQSFWLFDDVRLEALGNAVPEPPMLALMALGLAGVVSRRRSAAR